MKKIMVLLSTFNGEKYLREQLDSIISQREVAVSILIRDDGSSDATKSIIKQYKMTHSNIDWYEGPNIKSAQSFLDLVRTSDDSADYYAFSDQDDVWYEDKLIRAINKLEMLDNDAPRLYCSNYQLVDAKLHSLPEGKHVSTDTFKASIVSSCCAGCTTVFDRTLKKILSKYSPIDVVMHDDWAHKVCLAVGGRVIYDSEKTMLYRQHDNNVEGGIRTIGSRAKKIRERIKNKDRIRSKQLSEILRLYGEEMSDEDRKLMMRVAGYASLGFWERLQIVMDSRIKTPYTRLNRGFVVAIMLKYF